MPERRIAIIGGGAKAAALAAKAHLLQRLGTAVHVVIFEKDQLGAAWSGDFGYTDGDQRLCTPAERDLGFPYSGGIAQELDLLMQAEFSWAAFKVHKGGSSIGYGDWVNRGRKPASHKEFAEYIDWAIHKSEAEIFFGDVKSVVVDGGKWTVGYAGKDGSGDYEIGEFDGVVVTGPGPAKKTKFESVSDSRIFDGVDFWSRLDAVRQILSVPPKTVAIVGGGGTAAAIAAWIVRNWNDEHEVFFVNSQAMLFTRTASFFESRLFDDSLTWRSISAGDRRAFTTRLNRGVVWEAVTDILADARKVALLPGRAEQIKLGPAVDGEEAKLSISHKNDLGTYEALADLVVDATGFDAWWFRRLFDEDIWKARTSDDLEMTMREDLSFDLAGKPRLHAPMHSQIVGPGFVSLMVLGDMSDRILKPYAVDAAT